MGRNRDLILTNEQIYAALELRADGKLVKAWNLKDIMINILSCMFKYEDLPDSIPQEFVERFHILNGDVAIWRLDDTLAVRYKDELIASVCGYAGAPDVYGLGERIIANTLSGYTKELIPGEDCVVIHNNSIYTSDMLIISMAVDMITEMFTSLKTNIIYSRLKPVFRCTNDLEEAAIKKAFADIKEDLEPIQITSRNVSAEQLADGTETIKVLDITDVKNADKLQYIVKAIDDAFRWFLTLYGQAIQGNAKLAQQTVDEVQGTTSSSFILPNDRLRMRRKGWDEVNKLFGTNISVDFSDAWKTESLKYKKEADLDENGELEELEEETGEETEEETVEETVEETEGEAET